MRQDIETIALNNKEYFTIQSGKAINPNSDMFCPDGIRPFGSLPYITPPDINSFEIIVSDTITRRNLNDDGIKNVQDKVVPPFPIICIRSGPSFGKVCFTKVSCAISHYVLAITVNDKNKLLPRYVFHTLDSQRNHIRLLGRGSRIPHLFISEFKSISIPLLTIERQAEIIEKASSS